MHFIKEQQNSILEFIRKNWSIILFLLSILLWATNSFFNNFFDVSNLKKSLEVQAQEIDQIKEDNETINQKYNEILIRLSAIDTNVTNIKSDIQEIKQEVKDR